MNLTIPYVKKSTIPRCRELGVQKDGDILTFDWGSRLDLVAANKWDTFRKCGCKKPCSTNKRCGCHKTAVSSSSATTTEADVLGCTTLCSCFCNASNNN